MTRHRQWTRCVLLIGAVLVVLGGLAGCGRSDPALPVAAGSTEAIEITRPDVGFRSQRRFDEHYDKHGREFGAIGADEYLRLAQTLRDRPVGEPVLESVRRDGVITRFDRDMGAFIAFERDGVIRTFFKPNGGEAYFRRQAAR